MSPNINIMVADKSISMIIFFGSNFPLFTNHLYKIYNGLIEFNKSAH